ncbi:hypothetical protein CAPTEDRAFT_161264 [Capitella teleta]|uniref:FAD-binding PCMH-type domain-containing protein n=1 Tax=Capitella teleta TaxID=283909 RepID=R7TQM4_CAPTE|nr:hypothetical protein CAPTEDRAFT_161264 [Capitella teleta]|eukprot:ELT96233.1 hypothetical protein CAPTEDRAFT_161264 [Capitella teleta]
MLSDFIRDVALLKGTKIMCREGGCGSCVVTADIPDLTTMKRKTVAVNSCLCSVYSCDDWLITTTEGIGDSRSGLHPIQTRLARYNGSQCGFCSPGMVMNMHSLLQNNSKPTKKEVEDSFDGHICRCTGYRSILDAMCSFADDVSLCVDIEVNDYKHLSPRSKYPHCPPRDSLLLMPRGAPWFRPNSLQVLFDILGKSQFKQIALVVGNTSTGYLKNAVTYDAYIDTTAIQDLYSIEVSSVLTFGANVSLTKMIEVMDQSASQKGFEYLIKVTQHLRKVANTSVRNVACWAGNLMLKHTESMFPSDVFLLFAALGVNIKIQSSSSTASYSMKDFMTLDMKGKVILSADFPKLSTDYKFRSYKISPRLQGSLAYVNAAFLLKLNAENVVYASIVFGGISSSFIHATNTEAILKGKDISQQSTLSAALKSLIAEVRPEENRDQVSSKYRQDLACALFFRFVLDVCGDKIPERLRSGALGIERPVSSGSEDFSTDTSKWPLTQPLMKTQAFLQSSGEAQYVGDIPDSPQTLHAAFVFSAKGNCMLRTTDPSEALAIPGVRQYLTYADIPTAGSNNFMPQDGFSPEEIFCSNEVLYAGQCLGLILADSQVTADLAAQRVKVTYTNEETPITDIKEAINLKSFFPKPSEDVLKGQISCRAQSHFHMETQSCLVVPKEAKYEVFPTSQWPDLTQQTVAQVLGIKKNQVRVKVNRLGGAYGAKISRNFQISAACALGSHVTNRPVKMHMNFNSNMEMIGRRFPWLADYEVGVDKDGRLLGLKVTLYSDAGCSPNDHSMFPALYSDNGFYHCENWHLIPVLVKTNTPGNTYCRAPGYLPGIYIMESIMEDIARKLGKDPIDVRRINFYQKGQLLGDFLVWADINDRKKSIEKFNKANRWRKKWLSVVPMRYSIEWTGVCFSSIVSIYIGDGSVSISTGGIEMGQGLHTKVLQVCSYELGIPINMVNVEDADTISTANNNVSSASISSELCCKAVLGCCKMLNDRLSPYRKAGVGWTEIVQKSYADGVDLSARHWVYPKAGQSVAQYQTYGVSSAEVELDILTGQSQINRVDMTYDCGQSINPKLDIGQAQGAFIMGLGYWLTEEIKYDRITGKNINNSTWGYHPPLPKDIPVDFRIRFLKDAPNPDGVLGSKAVGEPPQCMSVCAPFALRNAVEAARLEIGQHDNFAHDSPYTVEKTHQLCLPDITQYVLK